VSARLREALYREVCEYVERAERTRRWNPFTDVAWGELGEAPSDSEVALCAETFLGVEMMIPDYLSHLSEMWRGHLGSALATANWGYEEMKHSLALREYLGRSGARTEEQLFAFEEHMLGQRWTPPFDTPRAMVAYTAIQEMTTFVNYLKHEQWAKERGHHVLARIYQLIARDEIAHCRMQERVLGVMLEEDTHGTLLDLARAFHGFRMPSEELLPDVPGRREVFRRAGIDHGVFVKEVWLVMLKRMGIRRADLPLVRSERAAEAG
jgi:acyl-[acyl-carrier-protein] desaturase